MPRLDGLVFLFGTAIFVTPLKRRNNGTGQNQRPNVGCLDIGNLARLYMPKRALTSPDAHFFRFSGIAATGRRQA
jgi:hypothetical protein